MATMTARINERTKVRYMDNEYYSDGYMPGALVIDIFDSEKDAFHTMRIIFTNPGRLIEEVARIARERDYNLEAQLHEQSTSV